MRALGCLFALYAVTVADDKPICPRIDCKRAPEATNVRHLSPCHITTVMAMGDSITAAAVPYPIWDGIDEYRDISFSIGGGVNVTTFPNILQQVTGRTLKGASVGHHGIEFRNGPHDHRSDNGNAAQSGAFISDLIGNVGNQTAYLEKWLEAANIKDEEWKVMTIFIGANDICRSCTDLNTSTTKFAADLDTTLTMLRRLLKRTFVNVLPIFEISQVYDVTKDHPYCHALHDFITECGCLWHHGPEGRKVMDEVTAEYNRITFDTALRWDAKGYEDFTVVAQPHMVGFKVPGIDWVSPIDCFHPTPIAHATLAKGLWYEMMRPVKDKKYPLLPNVTIPCPGPRDVFGT